MPDAMYEIRVEVQRAPDVNLLRNPGGEVDASNIVAAGNSAFARETTVRRSGSGSIRVAASAVGQYAVMLDTTTSATDGTHVVVPGDQRTLSVYAWGNVAHSAWIGIRWLNAAGATIGSDVLSSTATLSTTSWTRLWVSATAPSGAVRMKPIVWGNATTGGTLMYLDDMLLSPTLTLLDAFDWSGPDLNRFSDTEYGWDNQPDRSTSRRVDRSTNVTLPDADIVLDYDLRRVPFMQATVTAPIPDAATLTMLDPRRGRPVILNYSVIHYTRAEDGTLTAVVSMSPIAWPAGTAGKLWVRRLDVDWMKDTITLHCSSGECVTEDKKRISWAPLDTGAPTALALWLYAITDVGEANAVGSNDGAANLLTIPAGDRRLWLQGEPASSVYENELAAIDLRHFCDDVGTHTIRQFGQPPGRLGTASRLTDGDEGTLIAATETLDRTGDWRDATLIKSDYVDTAGVRHLNYQRYPESGDNRKGEVTDINRPIPSDSYAQQVNSRASRRGRAIRLEAQCDFTHRVGRTINLTISNTGGGPIFGITPEQIIYRPAEGTMAIEGYRNS